MFHILTPPFVLEAYAANQLHESSTAVCLFVDTAGFTPLTSALMTHGTEGAEVLAQVLAGIFTPLLTIVYEQGGYVAGFAGDAFKAIFPGLSAASHQCAITAAWQIRQHLLAQPIQTTRFGAFRFAVKVTVASGPVEWRILRAGVNATGVAQQAALFFGGTALAQTLAADPLVKAGEIVLTAAVAEQLPTTAATLTPVADHFRLDDWSLNLPPTAPPAPHPARLSTLESAPLAIRHPPPATHPSPLAHHFFPTELLERQTQGEFRQVVTVFVNLQTLPTGATATNLVTALFQLLTQYGGYLCRIGQIGERDSGGTLLFFWGAPTSHENDVVRALHFALAVQTVAPTPVRIGITTALAYAGFVGSPLREEYTCYGAHVNLAARHMVMAGWGEIWLDPTTAQLAGAAFSITEHTQLRFKGFAEARTVYRLLHQQPIKAEPFYQGTLIGRAAELAQLQAALAPLATGQCAGLITISGEAGVGKSRLVYELQNWTRINADERGSISEIRVHPRLSASNIQWFLCQTDEILRQPLNPFRYWLRNYFNQATSAAEATNKAAFTAKLDDLLANLAPPTVETPEQSKIENLKSEITRTRSFLGALVDLYWTDSLYAQVEPQLRFENTLAALKTLVLAESLCQPVILHLEDAHWLDVDSQTFLARLLHNVPDYPLAVIVTQRPGGETERQGEGETRKQGEGETGEQGDTETGGEGDEEAHRLAVEGLQTLIRLTTLTADEIRALAAMQLQGTPAPALVTLLEERAEGNPFFAEQLLHYLREQGWLVQGAEGWQLRPELAPTTLLPHGARALLIARLDQLPQPVKEVVQTAAVLGREFDTNVLAQMLADDQTLATKLAVADHAAIWHAMPQARYLFRHALLREAAYDMQLRARLRALHHRAGAALEQVYGGDLTPYLGELAYHYDQAEAAEQAVQWYGRAGEQASKQYANETAARYFRRALALTPTQDAMTRYGLLLGSEAAHNWLGRRQPQQDDLTTLEAVTVLLNDAAKRSEVLLRKTAFHLATGRYQEAAGYAEQAVAFAGQAGDALAEARAYHRWGRAFWQAGQYQQALPYVEEALRLSQVNQGMREEANCLYDLAVIHHYQTNLVQATAYINAAAHLYEILGDKRGLSLCYSTRGLMLMSQGAFAEAFAQYAQALKLTRAVGWRYAEARLLIQCANSQFDLGSYQESSRLHEQAFSISNEIGDKEGIALSLDTLGLIAANLMQPQQAIDCFHRAREIYTLLQDQRGQGFVLTHWGYTLMAQQQWQEAESILEQALELRSTSEDHGYLMDTLIGLAYIMFRRGKREQAWSHASQVFEYIEKNGPSGFEFPVLVYLLCCRLLRAFAEINPTYAITETQMLEAGYHLLLQQANRIQDLELRSGFLQNIWFNQELQMLWTSKLNS